MAVPRMARGAMREAKLGWVASSALKPQKKTNNKAAKAPRLVVPTDCSKNPPCTSTIRPIDTRNTFLRWPRRSMANTTPKNKNDTSTAGKYTCQCCAVCSPACTSKAGTDTHMASCTACNTNTPTFKRIRSAWASTSRSRPRPSPVTGSGAGGAPQMTTPTPMMASTPVSQNSPDKPIQAVSKGETTKDSANIKPMLPPTKAMALVRTSSRVRSASKAVTAADTAPAPCRLRPISKPVRSVAAAAQKLPKAKMTKPSTMTRLRPKRSEAMPNGSCKRPCVRP